VLIRFLAPLLLAVPLTMAASGAVPDTVALENQRLKATMTDGRLETLVDLATGETLRFEDDRASITINGQLIDLSKIHPTKVPSPAGMVTFAYTLPSVRVALTYELRPGWGFLSKQLKIEPTGPGAFRVNEVTTLNAAVAPASTEQLPLTEGRFGMVYRMPPSSSTSKGSSLIALYQNPYNVHASMGVRVRGSYAPEMDWHPATGPFETDRLLLAMVARTGRVMPAKSVPEWVHVADYDRYLRENPVIDDAESEALADMVRSFLQYRPARSIRVHVPWTENDYQIDVATPEGWTEYQRILDMAGQLGVGRTLFAPSNSALAALKDNRDAWGWENLLFFGLGQKIRKGEWVPGRDPVPASLRMMLDKGASHGLKLMAYAYPTLPFMQDPAWTAWAKGDLGGYRGADTGQRGFQDWWVNTLVAFVKATGAGGFSFDHWWIAYDDPAATSKYAQWFGARRILEELRRRVPDIVIDGRQQYMSFGPWTWLAGSYPHPTLTDEQPESFLAFPDLHTDRVSADRQRFAAWKYRVERFTPPEIMPGYITHQTERTDDKNVMRRDRFRPRDWDVLGWKYSLFSSIGTAPFNHTISYIPARDEAEFKAFSAADKAFFRRWLDWTDANAEVLRHLKPIIGPPMLGRVDGTAAINGNHGFVFVYNPNYRRMDGAFTLDQSIGLAASAPGERYVIKELHPYDGRLVGKPAGGVWSYGDTVHIDMAATEAVVLEISPAAPMTAALLFNATGKVTMADGVVTIAGVSGEPGTSVPLLIQLPPGPPVIGPTRLLVNGRETPFRRQQNVVEATVTFEGRAFGRAASVFKYDAAFTGGTLDGTVVIPGRVLTQLAARKAAWPVPYTADDLLAPWLGSHRLLLFVQIAEPDEGMAVALTIDGKPVELIRAYNSIYGHSPKRTFLGFYADVSALAPDVAHQISLRLPPLQAGRFQGLFFENVEPELTTTIRR
jgi:hypothetical protein